MDEDEQLRIALALSLVEASPDDLAIIEEKGNSPSSSQLPASLSASTGQQEAPVVQRAVEPNAPKFITAKSFNGKLDGYGFKNGEWGLGYYLEGFDPKPQILLRATWRGGKYEIQDVPTDATILQVKEKLEELTMVPIKRQKLLGFAKGQVSSSAALSLFFSYKPDKSHLNKASPLSFFHCWDAVHGLSSDL
jgi:hypothetical protein